MAERATGGSLRARVLALALAAVAAIWLAAAAYSYFEARHEVAELLDGYLAQAAGLLIAQAGEDLDELDVEHAPQLHRYARRLAFQVWERGRVLRLHSPNAPDTRLSPRDEGFSDVDLQGGRWRVFSSWDAGREVLVQVAEERHARDDIAAAVGASLVAPLLVALPLLGLLLWVAVSLGLRPLRLLGAQVARRTPHHLAPVAVQRPPAEVAPLVADLNRLLERVRWSIEHERRFTADAAHELRTPLAGLRAQAQVARAATDDSERLRALDQVVAGCDRGAHLVDQLLVLARLDPREAGSIAGRCDLRCVAREVVAETAPFALRRGIDVELTDGEACAVGGDPTLLATLLRNLLDNAVRYSPPGTTAKVAVRRSADGKTELVVSDAGPGVPSVDREHLGERFFRLPGTEEPGSGLGLSIVRRIAELHGAEVRFAQGESGRGLVVTVSFPPERSSSPTNARRQESDQRRTDRPT